MKMLPLVVTFSACLVGLEVAAEEASCEQRTTSAFPDYQLTSESLEPGAPSLDPVAPYSETRGDYDGDGTTDVALLLGPTAGVAKHAISVCLSSKPSRLPELILDAYTAAPLSTTPKGRKYHDYNTETVGTYELDGVGSYCCECCGATYIYRNGRFAEIIDGD